MKKKLVPRIKILIHIATFITLISLPGVIFGQAPDLGAASSFSLFTAVGAFSNTGASLVTGDIGTNVGSFTGFPPGVVIGQIHVADGVSAQAAPDVLSAYGYLSTLTCGLVIGTTLGNGQILTPNTYCAGAASTLNGNLTLDGQGDPNAIFIIRINGALATSTNTNVFLINSASLCNVYWQVNGQFTLGENSTFRGTLINAGAINLLNGATLLGRALSTSGAISLHTNLVTIGTQPLASTIIANGPIIFCAGGSVVLSGNTNGGTWNTGETTPTITVTASGDYYVTNTNDCSSIISNHIIVLVNPKPTVNISASGPTIFCQGGSVILTASSNFAYLWSNGATSQSISVSTPGNFSVIVTNTVGCTAISAIVNVIVNPLPIVNITPGGPTTFCQGGTVQLCASTGSIYLWSTNATTQCINATQSGAFSVTVTNAEGCKASASVVVTVNAIPVCSISGNLSFCTGQTTQLCAPSGNAAYLWSTGATTSCISVTDPGIYAVTITNTNACTSTCNVTVTLNSIPNCLISGESFICNGQSTQLCVPAGSGTYLWSSGANTNCITINNPGTYSVTITNTS
ncbi:MAG TPA: ice-binding family protein, partial [Saprospiraceae bacterium]|nr:ice-binding family protein [Saprospiraceae bacterium]